MTTPEDRTIVALGDLVEAYYQLVKRWSDAVRDHRDPALMRKCLPLLEEEGRLNRMALQKMRPS